MLLEKFNKKTRDNANIIYNNNIRKIVDYINKILRIYTLGEKD